MASTFIGETRSQIAVEKRYAQNDQNVHEKVIESKNTRNTPAKSATYFKYRNAPLAKNAENSQNKFAAKAARLLAFRSQLYTLAALYT
ncbi:MAG: hypothetical protein WA634_16695 [Silvibacterium sp.]